MTSLLTSLVSNPYAGGELWPYLFVTQPGNGGNVGAWPSANAGIFCRFRVQMPRTATGLRIISGAGGGDNAKLGLYSSDGSTLTQVAMSAATAVSPDAAKKQDIPFQATAVIVPGIDYWAFMAVNATAGSYFRITMSDGNYPNSFLMSGLVASTYSTPPPTQALSALTTASSGYTPILLLY